MGGGERNAPGATLIGRRWDVIVFFESEDIRFVMLERFNNFFILCFIDALVIDVSSHEQEPEREAAKQEDGDDERDGEDGDSGPIDLGDLAVFFGQDDGPVHFGEWRIEDETEEEELGDWAGILILAFADELGQMQSGYKKRVQCPRNTKECESRSSGRHQRGDEPGCVFEDEEDRDDGQEERRDHSQKADPRAVDERVDKADEGAKQGQCREALRARADRARARFDAVEVDDDEKRNNDEPVGKVGDPLNESRGILIAEERAEHGKELVITITAAGGGVPHGGIVPVTQRLVAVIVPVSKPIDFLEFVEGVRDEACCECNENKAWDIEKWLNVQDEQTLEDKKRYADANNDGKNTGDRNGTPGPIIVRADGAEQEDEGLYAFSQDLHKDHEKDACFLAGTWAVFIIDHSFELSFDMVSNLLSHVHHPDDHPREQARGDKERDAFEDFLGLARENLAAFGEVDGGKRDADGGRD